MERLRDMKDRKKYQLSSIRYQDWGLRFVYDTWC